MADVHSPPDLSRHADLDFEAFRRLALDPSLSRHEKVGFPDSYREGREEAIFADLRRKLRTLSREGATVLEIGPGCSALPLMLADSCAAQRSTLWFVDSAEMLALLPDAPHLRKQPGAFPAALDGAPRAALRGRVDTIVAYSVIQYVFAGGNVFEFLDRCLELLADGGELLIGDIPNVTMRKRFFAGAAGHACHRAFTGRDAAPDVRFNVPEPGQIDDGVVFALLQRARAQGFHAWVLPQPDELPMGHRREDLLVRKP